MNGGMRKMTKAEKMELVKECRTSGITAKAWCQEKGIQYRQYIAWATELNRERSKQIEPREWASLTLVKEEEGTNEIKINCGKWTIYIGSGCNPAILADVLKVIDAIC
jgi:transposase-like protein